MLDLKDLWNGDLLRIVSSNQIGTFEGMSGDKAKVKIGNAIITVAASDLERHELKETPETFFLEEDKSKKSLDFHLFESTLDLHIEKLAPQMKNMLPVRILSYQLEALDNYIQRAELKSSRILTIIHGKGRGVLKSEVKHYLEGRKSVKIMFETNDGGALEVHLY